MHPWAAVLHDQPSSAFAAWCWRKIGAYHYVAYVVGPHGDVIQVNNLDFTGKSAPCGAEYGPGNYHQTD